MSDKYEKIYFEPSTVETIDRSVYDFIKGLNLHASTNKGRKIVPIMWGTAERSFLTKNSKEKRDLQGTLIYPAISIKRSGLTKPSPGSGVFIGNIPGYNDEQGGSIVVSKVINQEKTSNFASADAKKKHGQVNYPRKNNKIVHKTISVPMPVNIETTYEVTIRTEFQQQMNELMMPFITLPGTVKAIQLKNSGHTYEGFIEGQYQSQDNMEGFNNEERKFETRITIRVIGYIIGQQGNSEKPFYAVRENAVEIKIPKERLVIDPEEMEKYGL